MDGKNYSIFIETLKKMYAEKKIDISKIKRHYTQGIINLDEYDYILGKKEV